MPLWHFAIGLLTGARARMTRWCRQREAEYRTLLREAWRLQHLKKTELKLTGVARASLEELLLDFEAFLRQKGLRIWTKNSPEAMTIRKKYQSDKSDLSDMSDPYGISKASPEVAANTLICLINQASYLLGRQLQRLEQQFLTEGGFTERLYKARSQVRRTR